MNYPVIVAIKKTLDIRAIETKFKEHKNDVKKQTTNNNVRSEHS
jgi:hypothetical protein